MVKGLSSRSVQGDMVYRDIFKELSNGCPTIDVSDCPDLAPIIMAVAAAKNGAKLTGTNRLRIKESDRGEAMKAELEKMGAKVLVEDNKITVKKANLHLPERPIFSHNDHRIVMAMSVLLSITGGEIIGAEAVAKSYPKFFDDILSLGIMGLGLLGGSYAKGLKKLGFTVNAITKDRFSIDYAMENGIIDFGTTDVNPELVGSADIVIFALYPHVFTEWIKENQKYFKSGAVITDVTGVKGCVVHEIQSILRSDVEYIAAHTMAGKEVSVGVNSEDAIFKGAN